MALVPSAGTPMSQFSALFQSLSPAPAVQVAVWANTTEWKIQLARVTSSAGDSRRTELGFILMDSIYWFDYAGKLQTDEQRRVPGSRLLRRGHIDLTYTKTLPTKQFG